MWTSGGVSVRGVVDEVEFRRYVTENLGLVELPPDKEIRLKRQYRRLEKSRRRAVVRELHRPQPKSPPKSPGALAEYRFVEAWSRVGPSHAKVASVRRSTLEEDHNEQTDAVLTLLSGEALRFQIKSSPIGAGLRHRLTKECGVIPIFICVKEPWAHSPKTIRKNTWKALERYLNDRARHGLSLVTRPVFVHLP